jgi:excisionase family DNA binding protein
MDKTQTQRGWLTLAEVADSVGCGLRTVQRWVRQGLPVCRVGKIVRVSQADLDAWLRQHVTACAPDGPRHGPRRRSA